MSFGPRREIIAALANDRDLSAADLARRLKRPVTGLYRHLDLLVSAGLLRQSGKRPGPKRPEALYALTFPVFSADSAAESEEGRRALAEVAGRYAAAAARKFRRAVEVGAARIGEPDANTRLQMSDLQLDRAGLIEFNRLLNEFIIAARKLRVGEAASTETISVAVLVAPMG